MGLDKRVVDESDVQSRQLLHREGTAGLVDRLDLLFLQLEFQLTDLVHEGVLFPLALFTRDTLQQTLLRHVSLLQVV